MSTQHLIPVFSVSQVESASGEPTKEFMEWTESLDKQKLRETILSIYNSLNEDNRAASCKFDGCRRDMIVLLRVSFINEAANGKESEKWLVGLQHKSQVYCDPRKDEMTPTEIKEQFYTTVMTMRYIQKHGPQKLKRFAPEVVGYRLAIDGTSDTHHIFLAKFTDGMEMNKQAYPEYNFAYLENPDQQRLTESLAAVHSALLETSFSGPGRIARESGKELWPLTRPFNIYEQSTVGWVFVWMQFNDDSLEILRNLPDDNQRKDKLEAMEQTWSSTLKLRKLALTLVNHHYKGNHDFVLGYPLTPGRVVLNNDHEIICILDWTLVHSAHSILAPILPQLLLDQTEFRNKSTEEVSQIKQRHIAFKQEVIDAFRKDQLLGRYAQFMCSEDYYIFLLISAPIPSSTDQELYRILKERAATKDSDVLRAFESNM